MGATERRVVFALFPHCEIMDFAGPIQAFGEASAFGAKYRTMCAALTPSVVTGQGVTMSDLAPLGEIRETDRIVVPGYSLAAPGPPRAYVSWLRRAAAAGAQVCSVCTGAFVLGEAGLLDGRKCTTHWRRVDELRRMYPRAVVIADRLFVADGPIVTSAGIASGIDMALALIEGDAGPVVASHVAREMVVYLRRDGSHHQESVYLDYQTHLNPGIHRAQQYLINTPSSRATLAELASMAAMSERNFTRAFRNATGISVAAFREELRFQRARILLRNPEMTIERVARECGFSDARQLRRMWRARAGQSPSAARDQGNR